MGKLVDSESTLKLRCILLFLFFPSPFLSEPFNPKVLDRGGLCSGPEWVFGALPWWEKHPFLRGKNRWQQSKMVCWSASVVSKAFTRGREGLVAQPSFQYKLEAGVEARRAITQGIRARAGWGGHPWMHVRGSPAHIWYHSLSWVRDICKPESGRCQHGC